MDVGAVKESLRNLSTAQLAQMRNYLLSQDVESLGLSADQALGLLQAIEERDTRDAQPNYVPGQPVSSFPVSQQPAQMDISKVMNLFSSALGSHGRVDNSMVYQPATELSTINERVQMLEMQRQQIISAQKHEQQDIQSAIGDGRAWTGPDPKRRMISNDVKNFNEEQGFQGNWMQGTNQMNQSGGTVQMNQSGGHLNQSGGGPEMNQSRDGAKMKWSRGGYANDKKQKRNRRKNKQKQKSGEQQRGGQRWRSPGRPQLIEDSSQRRSQDKEDYYYRRSRSRESVGHNSRDNSKDRGQSYNRWSDDGDRRDDGGYGGRRREGSKNRDVDSHEKKYHERDDGYGYRSNDGDNRSYQGESQPYPESPRGDGYYRSESNEFQRDDQFDDGGDRHGRKRKHRDFDEGNWQADDRHDQEPPRRYSTERDYPDQRFSAEGGQYQEPAFDYEATRGTSRERDDRRWDDGPLKDILDSPIVREERWLARQINTSSIKHGLDKEFFLRQGEVFNPDMAQGRYREGDLIVNPPERRNLDLDLNLGRIQPIPLSVGLGGHRRPLMNRPARQLGVQLPGKGVVKPQGFQRRFSGPAIPSKDIPLSARMQGFVMRNQTNKKTKVKNPPLKKTVYQTKEDISLVKLLLKTGKPDKLPVKKSILENTKGADTKEAAGTPTKDQNKGELPGLSKSKDVQAVSGGENVAGKKTLTNRSRPKPLKPEANSISHQCDILEDLELQGFLYHRVMTLWTCYICRTALKNGMAYKIHLVSKNHMRTSNKLHSYEGAFDRRKIAFALRNLPNLRTVNPEQLSAGDVSRMYFCSECGEGYSCTELEHKKTERHLTLEAYRKCCNLCNVYCKDWKSLVKHQNSKLHVTMKSMKKPKEEVQVPGSRQNKTPISGNTPVPSKGERPVSSKAFNSGKTPISNKASFPTKALISNKATTSNKSSTLTKELSSDMTDNTAPQNISGLQSEKKSIKVTLKGTKAPLKWTKAPLKETQAPLKWTKAPVTDSSRSSKKGSKVEESEELIGLDLVIPVTGFFCRCCSKFYNNKHMAERNHCMTAEHKQKALAWFKSHGIANPLKKPRPSNEGEAKVTPQKPACPQPKPSQSDAIIIIDDDEDDVNTPNEKPQSPQHQDKAKDITTLTDSKLTPGAVNSKEDNGQVPDHGGNDLEDGEILSEGELSVNEQYEAFIEKMEAETTEQPGETMEDVPTKKMASGAVDQTIEGTIEPPSGEIEVKATDQTVQEKTESSSETVEVMAEDQATEEPLTSNGTDETVKENVEPPTTDPSVGILEEPPFREMEKASDSQNSDKTAEPPIRELDIGTTDLIVIGNAETSSGEIEMEQGGEDVQSGGVSDPKDTEQSKEDVADNLATEDDLYADLVENAPEVDIEENLESREEQGNEGDEEMDDDEDEGDTKFFIDEGTWEVRSEEDGSNGEPFLDDGILEEEEDDDDVLVIVGDEEHTNKDVEENDNDTAS